MVLGLAFWSWLASPAESASLELTDEDGITHFTNTPADPRYRRMPGMSGTAAGWLSSPVLARSDHGDLIREVAERHGVSSSLVEAVIRVESGFKPAAVSPKGARGLMQLMPTTAAMLGVRDAFDPRENVEGGVRHLRYLIDRYSGDIPLVLAAYNAGEAAVAQYGGIPPYPETQQYVQKILANPGVSAAGGADASRVVYRVLESDGTITYTNILPRRPQRPPAR